MDTCRPCEDCGGAHRMMEPCPERPGLLGLLRLWIEGDRSPMTCIAMVGTCVLVTLLAVGLESLVR